MGQIMTNTPSNNLVLGQILRGMNAILLAILLSLGITEATYASNASGNILSFAEILETPGNKVARCLMMVSPAGTGRYFCMYGEKNISTQKVSLSKRDNTDEGKILVGRSFSPYKKNKIGSQIQDWLCNDAALCSVRQADKDNERIEVIKTLIISEQLEIENTSLDKLEEKFDVNQKILRYELPPDSLIFFTDRTKHGKLYQFARGVHVFLRSLQANKRQSLVEKTTFLECKQTLNDVTQKNSECEQTRTDIAQKNSENEQKIKDITQKNKEAENELNWFVYLITGLFIVIIGLFIFGVFYFFSFKNKELYKIRHAWNHFSGEKNPLRIAEALDNFFTVVEERLFKKFPSTDKGVTLEDKLTLIVDAYEAKTSKINDHERDIEEQKRDIDEQKGNIEEQKRDIEEQKRDIGEQKRDIDEQKPNIDEQKSNIKAKENTIDELTQRERVYESLLFDYFYLPKPQRSAQDEKNWQKEIIQRKDIRASLKFALFGEVIACRKAVATIKNQDDAELNLCLKVLDIDKTITDYLDSVIQRHFASDIKMYKEGLITKWLHRVFRAAALLQTYYPDDKDLKALSAHLQTITAMLRAVFIDLPDLNIQFSEPRLLEVPPTGCQEEPDVGKDFKKLKAISDRVTERHQQGGKFVVDIKYYGMNYENRQHYGMTVIVYSPAWWQ
jgi:hypothetical protein